MLKMLNVRMIIVSKKMSQCISSVKMREESESGIKRREEIMI